MLGRTSDAASNININLVLRFVNPINPVHTNLIKTGSKHIFHLNFQSRRGLSCNQHKAPPVPVWSQNQIHTFCKHNTKLPNCCLSSSEMASLCSVAAGDFLHAHALFFNISLSNILLSFKVSRDTFHFLWTRKFFFSVFRVVQGEAKTPKIMGCCRAVFAFLHALKIGTFRGKWTSEWVFKTSQFCRLALYFLINSNLAFSLHVSERCLTGTAKKKFDLERRTV